MGENGGVDGWGGQLAGLETLVIHSVKDACG